MWTETTRPKYERSDLRYASDRTEAEWKVIGPLLPGRKPLGRPRTTVLRAVVNAILYLAQSRCDGAGPFNQRYSNAATEKFDVARRSVPWDASDRCRRNTLLKRS